MVLAIDELVDGQGTVVRKRVFDPDQVTEFVGVIASTYTLDAGPTLHMIHRDAGVQEASAIAYARALDRATIDDSSDEPEDFDVPGDDFGS